MPIICPLNANNQLKLNNNGNCTHFDSGVESLDGLASVIIFDFFYKLAALEYSRLQEDDFVIRSRDKKDLSCRRLLNAQVSPMSYEKKARGDRFCVRIAIFIHETFTLDFNRQLNCLKRFCFEAGLRRQLIEINNKLAVNTTQVTQIIEQSIALYSSHAS